MARDYDAERNVERLKKRVDKLEKQLKPIPVLVFYIGTADIPLGDVANYIDQIKRSFTHFEGYYNTIFVAQRSSADVEIELLAVDPQEYEKVMVEDILGKWIIKENEDDS